MAGSALKSLESLHAELVRAQRTMPSAHLQAEMARLASAVQRCTGGLVASGQLAAAQLDDKRKKNADLAAKNAATIKEARSRLQQAAAPPAANPTPLPPIDPSLGQFLRDELLDRFAAKHVSQIESAVATGILSDWQWNTGLQPT